MGRAAVLVTLLASGVFAQTKPGSYSWRTLIGSGLRGDGAPALEALLDGPAGLAEDAEGNLYIAEPNAGLIRRVRPDGVIERYAGSGTIDDGPAGRAALETALTAPSVLAMDREGRLLFADQGACRIRRVEINGAIADVAGTGRCSGANSGFPGAGGGFPGSSSGLRPGPALETDLGVVGGMAIDGAGRLIFSDTTSHGIRRLDPDGMLRALAGSGTAGFFGDGGTAASAWLFSPAGLVFDAGGSLYIADSGNCRVRRINPEGNMETVAGNGSCTSSAVFASGIPTTRALGSITALAYDRDTDSILVASPGQARVLKLEASRTRISSFLGSGLRGVVETVKPNEYRLDTPSGILVSAQWGTLVADATAFRVLQVRDGEVRTVAGSWPQLETYREALSTALLRPQGLCLAADGTLLVVDAGAERLLSVSPSGEVKAVAGARYPTGFSGGDGASALAAQLGGVDRVVCGPDGAIFLTQGSQIRAIDRDGIIRTAVSGLSTPAGLALDSAGRLYYSEAGAQRVSRYNLVEKSTTVIAGTGAAGFSGDGGDAASALLSSPGDLAFDSQGNLLIADRGNRRVRRVSPAGKIETIAGSYRGFIYSDISGERATDIGFGTIYGLAVDAADNVYISEYPRLSMVRPDGRIRAVTGYTGENDDGVKSYLDGPRYGCDSLVVDREGRLYLSLRLEGRVMVAEAGRPE